MICRKSCTIVVIGFWLIVMTLLVQREVLPRMNPDNATRRVDFAARMTDEPIRWQMRVGDDVVGSITSSIEPQVLGYVLKSRLSVDVAKFDRSLGSQVIPLNVFADFQLDGHCRLQTMAIEVRSKPLGLEWTMNGTANDDRLLLTSAGLALLPQRIELDIGHETSLVDLFDPCQSIVDLQAGKTWLSTTMDWFTSCLSPLAPLGAGNPATEVVRNRVVGRQAIHYGQRNCDCFVVERSTNRSTARTWVRVADGQVMQQELPFGKQCLTLVRREHRQA